MMGLAACPETKVPRDFGGETLKIVREDWEGVWRGAGTKEDVTIVVKNAEAGQMVLVVKDDEKKSGPKPKFSKEAEIDILLHRSAGDGGRLAFMTVLDKANSSWGSLLLVTLPESGVFHYWSIRHEAVEAAVKNGELSGKLLPVAEQGNEKAHNHTELASNEANYEKLTDPKYWEWTKPMTMVRANKK